MRDIIAAACVLAGTTIGLVAGTMIERARILEYVDDMSDAEPDEHVMAIAASEPVGVAWVEATEYDRLAGRR